MESRDWSSDVCSSDLHFTATPGILPPSTRLKLASIRCSSQVEPGDFTSDLTTPPTRALRPVIPINACTLRITATANTKLANAYSIGNVKTAKY